MRASSVLISTRFSPLVMTTDRIMYRYNSDTFYDVYDKEKKKRTPFLRVVRVYVYCRSFLPGGLRMYLHIATQCALCKHTG